MMIAVTENVKNLDGKIEVMKETLKEKEQKEEEEVDSDKTKQIMKKRKFGNFFNFDFDLNLIFCYYLLNSYVITS